jgi:hypothetical protein
MDQWITPISDAWATWFIKLLEIKKSHFRTPIIPLFIGYYYDQIQYQCKGRSMTLRFCILVHKIQPILSIFIHFKTFILFINILLCL